MKTHSEKLKSLLTAHGFPCPDSIQELPPSGSARTYFRISFSETGQKSLIASHNPVLAENIAQYSFTHHFMNKGLKVPEIYLKDDTYTYFILQDLGDYTLFDEVLKGENEQLLDYYKSVMEELLKFQHKGIVGLDLEVAYPTKKFDKRSVMWDLNYFKYYFLKTHELDFDEDKLENDFNAFADFMLTADASYFIYRDFQSRNIMLHQDSPWFIDFQGGRQGPLAYDVVSLLYQAKANLSEDFRNNILQHYLKGLDAIQADMAKNFMKTYPAFIYFRLMQVLGAYGFRGLIQRKSHFIQSIPFAIASLQYLLETTPLPIELPQISQLLNGIANLTQYENQQTSGKLKVLIHSFSYKKTGVPKDNTSNGGGFAFDCRALPNPGRIDAYKKQTGLQAPVIEFLESKTEVKEFLDNSFRIIDQSVSNYLERQFTNLQIGYGCTGGQHRSVYCATKLSEYIIEKYPEVNVKLVHLESKTWPV